MSSSTPSHHAARSPVRLVPPATGTAEASSLPLPLAPFVGRAQELMTLGELLPLRDVRLLTLTGPGGVGKTRLALELAAQTADQFPDGTVFVELAPIATPDLVLPAVARALGTRTSDGESWERRLISALQGRRLLVLDNVEHLPDVGPEMTPLLAGCPRLTILATSRAPIGIYGERVFPVLPLALPEDSSQGLPPEGSTAIAAYDAVQLFVVRAQAARPDFQLTNGNASSVAAICRRLDGLPLAIELAAARVAHLTLAAILHRLEERLTILTGGPRDHPERLRTMRDAISWSYDLLKPNERATFRCLSVCAGSFAIDEALAVAAVDTEVGGVDPVLGPLQGLLDHSLIQDAGEEGGEPRFRMLETIRDFAREQLLRDPCEADAAAARHAAAFRALAEHAEPALWGAEQGRWLDRLEADLPNMRAARAWFREAGDVPSLLSLAVALGHFWALRGHFPEGRTWIDEAIIAADRPDLGRDCACACYWSASLAYFQGDDRAAEASANACIALSEEIGYRAPVSFATYVLALLAQRAGDIPRAEALLEAALTAARDLDDDRITGYCLTHLARLAEIEGEFARATRRAAQGLAVHRANEDRFGIVVTLLTAAQLAIDQNDLPAARDALGEALTLLPTLRNHLMAAETLEIASRLVIQRGHADVGIRLWATAARLRTQLGVPVIAYWRGRHEAAIEEARMAIGERRFAAASAAGESLTVDEAIAAAVGVVGAVSAPPPAGPTVDEDTRLTRREMDVLRLLVEGRSDKEIAAALYVSPRTATTHVTSILGKLGVTSRTAAAAIAVRRGLA